MTPKALITGSTGFIGSHLVESLLALKWEVTCLIRPKSKTKNLSGLPVQTIKGDVDEKPFLEKAVQGQDYVFHVAARIRSAPWDIYDRANHLFTKNLGLATLNSNPNLKRFVYISSIAAAGPSPPGSYSNETQICRPTSRYGQSKLLGEDALRLIWDRLPVTIIRPPNVYGPRQTETELLIKLISKKIVPLLSGKADSTSLIYIHDLIEGILQASISPQTIGQIYYLTDGAEHSWREIILSTKDQVLGTSLFLPLPEKIIYLSAWIIDILKSTGFISIHFGRRIWRTMIQTPWVFSSAKAQKDFGFRPRCSLRAGLKETVQDSKQSRS
ncbi:MAG: NAD-dependent epimerase/dehydratase family protein [Candidatus Aminicenantes bacterium]|nr:NAD-dependent epimerase/dehydratase family protein [Candidatus Aminicenantes bacterium]